jgi:hypothetical protein
MCTGRPYMLGGGTSRRGLCRHRRSWRGTSKASGPLVAASSPRRLSEFAELRAVWLSYRRQNRYPDHRSRQDG